MRASGCCGKRGWQKELDVRPLRPWFCHFLCELGQGFALSSLIPRLTRGILRSFPVLTSQACECQGGAVRGAAGTEQDGDTGRREKQFMLPSFPVRIAGVH